MQLKKMENKMPLASFVWRVFTYRNKIHSNKICNGEKVNKRYIHPCYIRFKGDYIGLGSY